VANIIYIFGINSEY